MGRKNEFEKHSPFDHSGSNTTARNRHPCFRLDFWPNVLIFQKRDWRSIRRCKGCGDWISQWTINCLRRISNFASGSIRPDDHLSPGEKSEKSREANLPKKRFCALIALNSLLKPMGKERKLHLGRATNAQDAWIWFHRHGTLERKCPGKTVTIVTLLFPGPKRIIIEK